MTSRVAVVGSGVSGLTAAYVLSRTHQVTLFEADSRFGGHAHTHTVARDADAQTDRVDSGFIVHNDRTYPLLRALFAELDVDVHPTEMSMSISCEGCGLSYAGGRKLPGLFAQRRRLFDPRYLHLLWSVKRFQKLANALLDDAGSVAAAGDLTFGEFLTQHRFNQHFVHHYAIPVVACVWSSGRADALDYPAVFLFRFLRHHGFLSISGSPQWFTVVGGSRSYVDALVSHLDDARSGVGVRSVARGADGVELTVADGSVEYFDQVVIATHSTTALDLLSDPTPDEKRLLGAIDYSPNQAVLHRDTSMLPTPPAARASWNYRMAGCSSADGAPTVTYWMNLLQGIDPSRPYLVSLNSSDDIDPGQTIASMNYEHPLYTRDSVAAQAELGRLNDGITAFAGAYHGWGFHEDGCRSGVVAAISLGADSASLNATAESLRVH